MWKFCAKHTKIGQFIKCWIFITSIREGCTKVEFLLFGNFVKFFFFFQLKNWNPKYKKWLIALTSSSFNTAHKDLLINVCVSRDSFRIAQSLKVETLRTNKLFLEFWWIIYSLLLKWIVFEKKTSLLRWMSAHQAY